MSEISLKDRVVIITGAGGGLGKVYALQFASRGAKVVVNDLGGSLGGTGNSTKAADVVVDEIKNKGGIAVANYDNLVTNPQGILKTALDNFGTVDILINNAGILKDSSFKNMDLKKFNDVLDVHLNGAFKLTKLCWEIFKNKNYGRIIMTASPAGLYGNFGQSNYSCAKLALVGFGETLAKEGYKYNIKVNIISLLAKSRMTETVLPPDVLEKLSPEKVAPLVLLLTSDECPSTGSIYEVAAGLFAQIKWQRSKGLYLNPSSDTLTPEAILNQFNQISNFNNNQFEYPIMLKDYNKIWDITSKLPKNNQGSIKIKSLKDKVVIITGAGNGLGKSHAIWFAKYGAKVVVNDFNDPFTVVEEIEKAGGIAVGSKHDVYSQADQIVQTALDNFGTVDILINNAGILRDRSFIKMSEREWEQVIQIHVLATFKLCKLVWPIFTSKKSGYIINTTSTSGIYGNFGQANYASAKAGILAFTKTLAIEGKRVGIKCNAIAPHAETAMTKTIFKSSELNKFSTSQVSPMVVLLCSEELGGITGELYEVGAGWIGNTRWQRAKGAVSHDDHITPEFIKDNWNDVVDFTKAITLKSAEESSIAILESVSPANDEDEDEDEEGEGEDTENENKESDEIYSFDHHQVILYNLSVGATSKELKYVYESDPNFQVIPTFGVIPFMNQDDGGLNFDNLLKNYNPMKLLHGEHYLKINKLPLPTNGNLKTESFPLEVINKGKGNKKNVLLRSGYKTFDSNNELLFTNVGSYFIRDCETQSGSNENFAKAKEGISNFYLKDFSASGKPDFEFTFKTDDDLAALYRLNGDFNPLHIDPMFAKGGNFSKPILHGLCFYGISAKALLDHYGMFNEIKARFTSFVYPGETLMILGWKSGSIVKFQTWVVERNVKVIDYAAINLIDDKLSSKL
jgi:multifunctional beta-oxidation protein